jgi:hypothetical protein
MIASFETADVAGNGGSFFSRREGGGCHLKGERLSKRAWPPIERRYSYKLTKTTKHQGERQEKRKEERCYRVRTKTNLQGA